MINLNAVKLPSMPAVAQKILNLNMDNFRDQDALTPAICQCPVTTSRIISMANSANFAVRGQAITSVKEAVQRIGIVNAYNVAAASAMFSMTQKTTNGFDVNKLWMHGVQIRLVMQRLAKLMKASDRPSEQDIALSALLHDIGFIVYEAFNSVAVKTLLDRYKNRDDFNELSIKFFGISHEKLGGKLLELWGIPEKIVTAVTNHHHRQYNYSYNPSYSLCNLLIIAEALLAYSSNTYDSPTQTITLEDAAYLIGVDDESLRILIHELKVEGLPVFI